MNIQTIILLLQMAVSLLANPALSTNADMKAQAIDFANQAIALANQALKAPPETQLQTQITTSTPPTAPLIPTSTPEVQPTSSPSLNLGGLIDTTSTPPATPAPIVKKQVAWDEGVMPFGQLGLVSLEAENPGASTTLFEYHATRGLYDSATLTINGADYPMAITNIGGGQSSIAQFILDNQAAGLQSGQTYSFTVRIDTPTLYATKGGQITMP